MINSEPFRVSLFCAIENADEFRPALRLTRDQNPQVGLTHLEYGSILEWN